MNPSVNPSVRAVYDPHSEKYWDEASLDKEIDRTFDICHGCRLCFKYCTAFPSLFEAIDGHADGDVLKLSHEDKTRVIQECYQCKVCYIKCPYTGQDNHEYNLNFPALMQRATHIQARKKGVTLRDKILEDADMAGRLFSGFASKIANGVFSSQLHRAVIERILKIHRDKLMPKFHKTSFSRWYKRFRTKNPPIKSADRKIVLFSTCFVNYNEPQIGKDAIFVLEKNEIEVLYPQQNCCGMPGLNSGDLKWAFKKMKKNIKRLMPYIKRGYTILAVNPTCSLTLKKEYTNFLPDEFQEQAKQIAENTYDLHEYLFELKREGKLNRDFKSSPGQIGYHLPCHLQAQNIGYKSRDIMKLIPKAQVNVVDNCCGHNGNWAMKKENFALSLKVGANAFDRLSALAPQEVSTDCPLAAIQLKQGMKLSEKPVHPIQILARAYKMPSEGGFLEPVT